MALRTVVLDKASKINLDLNNLVVLYNEESFNICLDEIDTIVIEDPRCYVSLRLLTELCSSGINIILTNSSHMPVGTISTLYNNTRASKNIIKQINWKKDVKEILWTSIVYNKISAQMLTLINNNKRDKLSILSDYLNGISLGDITNREGLASRTYFKELFGSTFKRFSEDLINFALNYTYQIIRSKISQEIISLGYNSALGIFHKSEYNSFNLADDFIECFRPIVDNFVYRILNDSESDYLTPDIKNQLVNIINERIYYNQIEQKIKNCIPLYLQNMFCFLETNDNNKLIFPVMC